MKIFKLYGIYIMLLFSFFLLHSCGDDDGTIIQENVEQSIGTWLCTSSSDTSVGKTFEGLLVGAQIEIKSDGTYTSTAYSFGYSGTYVIKENTITAKNNRGETFVVTVSVNGDTMKWKGTSSTGVSFYYVFSRE